MDPKNTAILVIDMQEDFLTPRDSYLTQISKIKRLLAVGRIRNIPAFVIAYVNCGKTLDEFSPTASGNSSLLTKSNEDSFKNTGLEKKIKR
jgi:nicotinamidase-related amidase